MWKLWVVVSMVLARAALAQPVAEVAGPPSKTLARAIALYDREDYYSASIEFLKVASKETADDAGNQERVAFFIGKTQFKLGFVIPALATFQQIRGQPNHRYRQAALTWIAAVIEVVPGPESRSALDARARTR